MEGVRLQRFLNVERTFGYGCGSGDGLPRYDGSYEIIYAAGFKSGAGSCACCCPIFSSGGDGVGTGEGFSDLRAEGVGFGFCFSGIRRFNGFDVHAVDKMSTIITAVHGNAARGYILHDDLTLEPCFIAKVDDHFAHGRTLREAVRDAQAKAFADQTAEQRIAAFLDEIEPNTAYPVMTFFDWHHRLTGSCEAGRRAFAADRGIDLDGEMTREEFFELTKDAYGGEIIRQAMEAADGKTNV